MQIADANRAVLEKPEDRLKRRTRRAFISVGLLVFGFFGLAAMLQIGGAVIGIGQVAVESQVKTLMHPYGGVLTAIYVREGDAVKQGDLLMRLDSTVSGEGAAYADLGLTQLIARRARLEAEREGSHSIRFPAELTNKTDAAAREAMARERRLIELHNREAAGSRALLGQRINQYEEQIESFTAQITAIEKQRVLIEPELEGLRKLYARRLTPLSRINQLERTAVDLDGTRAALDARIAETRARIAETREQILNIDRTIRSNAATELAQVMSQLNEQRVRTVSASDTLTRSEIRAPEAGVVDRLAFTTLGSAVPANQSIVQIVPAADLMIIEAQIRPQDVDQVRLGQEAQIRFSSLNRAATPEVKGIVSFVAPDRTEDQRSGQTYYRVRIEMNKSGVLRKVGPLTSGMPVEVFVKTNNRSILSFITKPLTDSFSGALRSD